MESSKPASWGICLSPEQKYTIVECLKDETTVTFWDATQLPTIEDMEKDSPCLVWLSSEGLRKLQSLPSLATRHLELLPKVVLLDKHYTLRDFEEGTDYGIAEIVRPPFSTKRLKSVLFRAHEVSNMHHDIVCMTREIMLERELLERKNELLNFLVDFLINTSESMDANQILQKTFTSFQQLFAAKSMHAAIWQIDEFGTPALTLHISSPENSDSFQDWQDTLIAHAQQYIGNKVTINSVQPLALTGQTPEMLQSTPADGSIITLPIKDGSEKFGLILLLTDMNKGFGKDQAVALESALKHLALSINNAKRFTMMQMHADFDGLTKIHGRRHFTLKFAEEMERFHRYENPLSVIMLDIDNFKQINDTYGHIVGDTVLKEVAATLSHTIRSTDYCARYGGEEFVVLLPHTDPAHAFSLAERLRQKIAKLSFKGNSTDFSITVSAGLSYLTTGGQNISGDELLQQADTALYRAKKDGKNCSREHNISQQKIA